MTTCTTCWRTCERCGSAIAAALALFCVVAVAAQEAPNGWPTYHGDYSGQRHSSLTQITPANVHQLTLTWAFETGQTASIKASPILVDGVVYITAPDNVWAIDARSGRQIWRY